MLILLFHSVDTERHGETTDKERQRAGKSETDRDRIRDRERQAEGWMGRETEDLKIPRETDTEGSKQTPRGLRSKIYRRVYMVLPLGSAGWPCH